MLWWFLLSGLCMLLTIGLKNNLSIHQNGISHLNSGKLYVTVFYQIILIILFFIALNFSTPFDQTTYIGYTQYMSLCLSAGIVFGFILVQVMALFVGSCLFLRACCNNFKSYFNEMDQFSSIPNQSNQLKAKKLLVELVEFHIQTKK